MFSEVKNLFFEVFTLNKKKKVTFIGSAQRAPVKRAPEEK